MAMVSLLVDVITVAKQSLMASYWKMTAQTVSNSSPVSRFKYVVSSCSGKVSRFLFQYFYVFPVDLIRVLAPV